MERMDKDEGPKDRSIEFRPDDERVQANRKFNEENDDDQWQENDRRWEENPQDEEPGEAP